MQILVADDDSGIQNFLHKVLTQLGHEPTCCGDGVEAISQLGRKQFDLLITDILMPEEDGIGVIRYVKEMKIDIGIIAMSGGSTDMDKSVFLRCAAIISKARTIEKPFTIDELQAVLKDFEK